MKIIAAASLFSILILTTNAIAQASGSTTVDIDTPKPRKAAAEKSDTDEKLRNASDKAEDALKKILGEVSKAADKAEDKGKELWKRTKDNLSMSRADYIKKATSGLATMQAEVEDLEESGASVLTRDYFKPRVDSLKLHVDFCKRDLARLVEQPSEEAFRVKQRGFDRTLGFLGEQISLAREEAGL